MAFMDVKEHQLETLQFDWDNISVANNQLNNSQNFFSKKHYEHERLDEMEFLQLKMEKTELDESHENGSCFNKENIEANCTSPEDEKIIGYKMSNEQCLALASDAVKDDNGNIKTNDSAPGDENEMGSKSCNFISPNLNKKEKCPTFGVDMPKKPSIGQLPCIKVAANLACEWSTKKTIYSQDTAHTGAGSKSLPPPPQAYLVKDVFQRNREEAERRRAEEERKLREFRSRPIPDFSHHHELLKKRKPAHAVTVAITPQVLKNSRNAEEKRKKRLEEWKQKNLPPKFEPRSPSVLKEKPFVPVKKPMVVQTCPFRLHTEKRLQKRKHYDEAKHKALEEKHKQEEEERKRLEKERIKELRKAASFKARPNPFKH